jgi:pimeloyl-ACP methyl ester carboxylesterase
MAKRLDTEIHVVEDAAHSPAVENPQGLVDAWLPFLKENS